MRILGGTLSLTLLLCSHGHMRFSSHGNMRIQATDAGSGIAGGTEQTAAATDRQGTKDLFPHLVHGNQEEEVVFMTGSILKHIQNGYANGYNNGSSNESDPHYTKHIWPTRTSNGSSNEINVSHKSHEHDARFLRVLVDRAEFADKKGSGQLCAKSKLLNQF